MLSNPYAKEFPLTIIVRADMLETVAGYSNTNFLIELASAVRQFDMTDVDSALWLTICLDRHINTLKEN